MDNAAVVRTAEFDYRDERVRFGRPQQPGTRTGYLGIADLFRIIRRRAGLILCVIAVVMGGVLAFLAHTRPIYSSTVAVAVIPADPAVSSLVPNPAPTPTDEAAIQTKIELLQSRSVAKRVVDLAKLTRDREFAPASMVPGLSKRIFAYLVPARPGGGTRSEAQARYEATVDALLAAINVARVAHSNVINVTAS